MCRVLSVLGQQKNTPLCYIRDGGLAPENSNVTGDRVGSPPTRGRLIEAGFTNQACYGPWRVVGR